MNILLTSDPHLGKTTVCKKLISKLKAGGILCPGEDIIDIATGKTERFLYTEPVENAEKVGPYFIKKDSFTFGEKVIEKALENDDLIIIDEYGPLEFQGKGLHNITEKALKSNKVLILVRKVFLKPFLKRFGEDFKVFKLTEANRDNLHEEILKFISH
ncbi:MAG: nucleoside-triphosphatase [archaeon]